MFGAVDIGGTKTLVAVFDGKRRIVEQVKFPTPENYDEFVAELTKYVASLTTKEVHRVVAAIPGRLDRKHGVALAFGNLPWVNVPIQADLEKIFNAPVHIENDAKLAALAEALALKPPVHKALYLTISTGIGAGLIINGKIPHDFEDMEAGQMLLEYRGELRKWESFASGHAFQAKFGTRVSDTPADNTEAWYWLGRNIAIGLTSLLATLDPDIVIFGGGAGAHLEKFQARLQEELKLYENPLFSIPPIVKAKHPEEAVVYGCYEFAKQHHERVHA
jgi:predicted NBD/HSP70 family sugar kinase